MMVVEVPSGMDRIRAAASSPLSSGMLMSMKTTVGCNCRNMLQRLPRTVSGVHVMSHQGEHERHRIGGIGLIVHDQHLEGNLSMRHVFYHQN